MRENEQGLDRLKAERGKDCARLLWRPAELLVDQDNLCRNARPLDDGLTAHFFRIDFNEITPAPVHTLAPILSKRMNSKENSHLNFPS